MRKSRTIHIRGQEIGRSDRVYVMAEVGSNHGGSLERAKRFVDAARRAGCDAVKFQSLSADGMAARLRSRATRIDDAFRRHGAYLYDVYKKSETPREWLGPLRDYARRKKIDFVCTPFDEESVDLLGRLDIDAFKIASFEINYERLLERVARFRKPVILSTGMATFAEIGRAVRALERAGASEIAVLHCNIGYPPPAESVHLRAIPSLSQKFGRTVGFSDHTLGCEASLAAVALGARILEKHVRLERVAAPDYFFAMGEKELGPFVAAVRRVSAFLGRPWKGVSPSEKIYYQRGRRSLYATRSVAKGERLGADDVAVLRPCVGIPASGYRAAIGRRVRKNIPEGEPIVWSILK